MQFFLSTVTFTPFTPQLPPHVGRVLSGFAAVCWSLISTPWLEQKKKNHNHSALCQTDNPPTQTKKNVCVCVLSYVLTYDCIHVCCVSEVVEKIKAEDGVWRKEGNGVVGVAEWAQIVIITLYGEDWRIYEYNEQNRA